MCCRCHQKRKKKKKKKHGAVGGVIFPPTFRGSGVTTVSYGKRCGFRGQVPECNSLAPFVTTRTETLALGKLLRLSVLCASGSSSVRWGYLAPQTMESIQWVNRYLRSTQDRAWHMASAPKRRVMAVVVTATQIIVPVYQLTHFQAKLRHREAPRMLPRAQQKRHVRACAC